MERLAKVDISKFNEDTENLMEVFGIKSEDIQDLLSDFSEYMVKSDKVGYTMEQVFNKLNNLDEEAQNRYWQTILYILFQGVTKLVSTYNRIVLAENLDPLIKQVLESMTIKKEH